MNPSAIFSKSVGAGPELVLLHGWGMNADVWDGIVPVLAETHHVTCVDLPGHGRSMPANGSYALAAQAAVVARALPKQCVLLGWSLGGLLASQIALDFPQQVAALVLVASSPRFVRADDWSDAMQSEVLKNFSSELQADYQKTIKRFLAIQAMGSEYAREELRVLRERVFAHGDPDCAALAAGLAILMTADLRQQLSRIQCPVQIISGERDTLFPLAAAERTQKLMPGSLLNVISGAGHAPFLSHPDAFLKALQAFLLNQPVNPSGTVTRSDARE